jgi:hypothetical protein
MGHEKENTVEYDWIKRRSIGMSDNIHLERVHLKRKRGEANRLSQTPVATAPYQEEDGLLKRAVPSGEACSNKMNVLHSLSVEEDGRQLHGDEHGIGLLLIEITDFQAHLPTE